VKRCVFFDRDGVVNQSPGPGYVEHPDAFILQTGFVAAARLAIARGYSVAIATNQRGVARGIVPQSTLDAIHARMVTELASQGITLLGIYCCTHERNTCTCRKPQPGLLLEAARQHGLALAACWMVGDKESDVEAGRRAGCRTVLVAAPPETTRATLVVTHIDLLADALAAVLEDAHDQ